MSSYEIEDVPCPCCGARIKMVNETVPTSTVWPTIEMRAACLVCGVTVIFNRRDALMLQPQLACVELDSRAAFIKFRARCAETRQPRCACGRIF